MLGTVIVTVVLPEGPTVVAPVTVQVTFGKVLGTEQASAANVTIPLKLLWGVTVTVGDDELPA